MVISYSKVNVHFGTGTYFSPPRFYLGAVASRDGGGGEWCKLLIEIISSTNFNAQFSLFINNMFVTLQSSLLSTSVLCRRLQRAKIPDAV